MESSSNREARWWNIHLRAMTNVDRQLLAQMYRLGLPTIISGQVVALIVLSALSGEVSRIGLIAWVSLFTLLTLLRLLLVFAWRRSSTQESSATFWARLYMLFALFAGMLWGSLIAFYDPSLPLVVQLFILIVLVGMPVAAMPADSLYLPVFDLFSLPVLAAIFYWSQVLAPELSLQMGSMAAAYSVVLWFTARTYHANLYRSLTASLEKQQLVERLSSANSELEQMAYFDPLTGLSNRRAFQEQAEKAIDRASRQQQQLAVMLIDLDDFKQVNDTLGHEAGDRLLVSVADRLNDSLRQGDTLARRPAEAARFGGDEFIVLLEGINGRDGAELAAQRILSRLAQPVALGEQTWIPKASIGIALFPQHAVRLSQLMRSADSAMYNAKQDGRHSYRLFRPEEDASNPGWDRGLASATNRKPR